MNRQHRWRYHGRNSKSESLLDSFRHATRGLVLGIIFETNIRRHVFSALAVVILGLLADLVWWEWGVILFTGVGVVTLEFVNSAIEALADAVHPGYNESIQRSKDLSAAAVLCASVAAAAVGLFIFLPHVGTIALWLGNST